MGEKWYEKPGFWIVLGVAVLAFIIHESFVYGKDILAYGLQPCIAAFWTGLSAFTSILVTSVGGAAATTTLLSCVVIPVTTVSLYTIFRKVDEKPKALIIALSLFLNPLFIDVLKDAFGKNDAGEEDPVRKVAVSVLGVVTFLAGSYFWSLTSKDRSPKQRRIWRVLGRTAALILFFLPTVAILGYLTSALQGHLNEFSQQLTPRNIIGMVGLLSVAVVGIGLARYYEGP